MKEFLGTIKIDRDIIMKDIPVDKKFWEVYNDILLDQLYDKHCIVLKSSKNILKGAYAVIFDEKELLAKVVSCSIRKAQTLKEQIYETEEIFESA